MDNAARARLTAEGLHTLVEAELTEEGVNLHIRTQGVDRLPVRVEIGLLPGGRIRTQHFTQLMRAGEQVTILDGDIEITGPPGATPSTSPPRLAATTSAPAWAAPTRSATRATPCC